ncbi:MAG: hypothetical protein QMC00_05305, partial [Pseudomonadales bacterium]
VHDLFIGNQASKCNSTTEDNEEQSFVNNRIEDSNSGSIRRSAFIADLGTVRQTIWDSAQVLLETIKWR